MTLRGADITFGLNITLDQLGVTGHEFRGKVEGERDRRDRKSDASRAAATDNAMAGTARRAFGLLRPDRHGNVSTAYKCLDSIVAEKPSSTVTFQSSFADSTLR